MKIYFAGSIRGGRENSLIYAQLIEFMRKFGEVLTCHVGDSNVKKAEEQLTEKQIHDRDINWLLKADVVIAEVSTPSLGVGYEIGRAVEAGKPILCLYNNHADFELSALIGGCDKLNMITYDHLAETYSEIEKFLRAWSAEMSDE
jgi:nucleoside 2-deoxyribosyltransferase